MGVGASNTEVEQIFKELDFDGDGKLSVLEMDEDEPGDGHSLYRGERGGSLSTEFNSESDMGKPPRTGAFRSTAAGWLVEPKVPPQAIRPSAQEKESSGMATYPWEKSADETTDHVHHRLPHHLAGFTHGQIPGSSAKTSSLDPEKKRQEDVFIDTTAKGDNEVLVDGAGVKLNFTGWLGVSKWKRSRAKKTSDDQNSGDVAGDQINEGENGVDGEQAKVITGGPFSAPLRKQTTAHGSASTRAAHSDAPDIETDPAAFLAWERRALEGLDEDDNDVTISNGESEAKTKANFRPRGHDLPTESAARSKKSVFHSRFSAEQNDPEKFKAAPGTASENDRAPQEGDGGVVI